MLFFAAAAKKSDLFGRRGAFLQGRDLVKTLRFFEPAGLQGSGGGRSA